MHGAVDGFAHVVDGERGDGGGGEGFHFDAGFGGDGCGGCDVDGCFGFDGEIEVGLFDGEWVAEGDEVGRAFGGHDAGESGDLKDVAFFAGGAVLNAGDRYWLGDDAGFGHGRAVGDGF